MLLHQFLSGFCTECFDWEEKGERFVEFVAMGEPSVLKAVRRVGYENVPLAGFVLEEILACLDVA